VIVRGAVSPDHIDVSAPPILSPSEMVQYQRPFEASLQAELSELRKWYWGCERVRRKRTTG